MVQRKCGFDQTGNSGGSFCVSNLGLYTAESNVLKIGIAGVFRNVFSKNFF